MLSFFFDLRAVHDAVLQLGVAITPYANPSNDAAAFRDVLRSPLINFLQTLRPKSDVVYQGIWYGPKDSRWWTTVLSRLCKANEQAYNETSVGTSGLWGWKFPRAAAILPMLEAAFSASNTKAR